MAAAPSDDLLDQTEAGENTLYTTGLSQQQQQPDMTMPGYPDSQSTPNARGGNASSIESSSVDETSTMIADEKASLVSPEKFQVFCFADANWQILIQCVYNPRIKLRLNRQQLDKNGIVNDP